MYDYLWVGVYGVWLLCAVCYVCLYVWLYQYISPHKCLQKVHSIKQGFVLFLLGYYLSASHCYLGSILAFNLVIQISYQPPSKIYLFCHE